MARANVIRSARAGRPSRVAPLDEAAVTVQSVVHLRNPFCGSAAEDSFVVAGIS